MATPSKALDYWLVETNAKMGRFDGKDKKAAINQLKSLNQVNVKKINFKKLEKNKL